jgi:metal-responsive CopG/Arc/MetJ family transcriptional regulator
MQRRVPTKELNASNGRKLFSVNLSIETLDYLDELAKKSEMSRSGLVDLIIREFRDNKRSITITIGGDE